MSENNSNLKIVGWVFLLLIFVYINSGDYFSYTPPSPVKSIANLTEYTNDYKGLLKLQEAFIKNAKTIKPSVVSINKVKEIIENSSWYEMDPHDSWYLRVKTWLISNLRGRKYVVEGVGSGIVLDSGGYILTNYHVIEEIDRVLVKLSNGHEYFAKILGHDSHTDLAVLKISTLHTML